ncbi:MAG: MarR family transcriptional regulator [Dehalococcoidia bacterium]
MANPADDAFQSVLLSLFQLHGQVLHAADAMSADLGLTGARWQVLNVVVRVPMTVSQIARRLSLRRQSVQRSVDELRRRDIVALEPNPDDRRAPLVRLSPRGEALMVQLRRRQDAWVADGLEGVAPGWLETLAVGLGQLTERVRQATAMAIERLPNLDSSAARPTAPGRRLVLEE